MRTRTVTECWYCGGKLSYFRKKYPERKPYTDNGFCGVIHQERQEAKKPQDQTEIYKRWKATGKLEEVKNGG